MARMLLDRDSTNVHLNAARRHERLARRYRRAIGVDEEAIRQLKSAEAEEEIAQGKLRRKYEANYLDARKAWGRVFADRLFPQLKAAKRSRDAEGKVIKGEFAGKTA